MPELSVVCFRHLPDGHDGDRPGARDAVDVHQDALQGALERSGRGFLTTTRLHGRTWLRAGVLNYMATRRTWRRCSTTCEASPRVSDVDATDREFLDRVGIGAGVEWHGRLARTQLPARQARRFLSIMSGAMMFVAGRNTTGRRRSMRFLVHIELEYPAAGDPEEKARLVRAECGQARSLAARGVVVGGPWHDEWRLACA